MHPRGCAGGGTAYRAVSGAGRGLAPGVVGSTKPSQEFFSYPPDPLPRWGRGRFLAFFLQGASPLASPRLRRGRHCVPGGFRCRKGACTRRHWITSHFPLPSGTPESLPTVPMRQNRTRHGHTGGLQYLPETGNRRQAPRRLPQFFLRPARIQSPAVRQAAGRRKAETTLRRTEEVRSTESEAPSRQTGEREEKSEEKDSLM